jgi:hypothetical protein
MYHTEQMRELVWPTTVVDEPFGSQDFIAPMLRGSSIRICLSAMERALRVESSDFEGWGVFRPTAHGSARLVCRATLAERIRYLHMLPSVQLILCEGQPRCWRGIPANGKDRRFEIDGAIPVYLTEETRLFAEVEARFDGIQCWYERLDIRKDPATAVYLRRALEDLVEPDQLSRAGLTSEEREAYTRAFTTRSFAAEAASPGGTESQVAGVSSVKGPVLQVAGIRLAGEDAPFDLDRLAATRSRE